MGWLKDFVNYFKVTEAIDILPDKNISIAETSIVFAHNAFNSRTEGSMLPNQQLNLTELMDVGARGLELDLYWHQNDIRLCHLICADWGLGANRQFSDALVEIKQWLERNPNEVLFLKLEDYLDDAPKNILVNTILNHFDRNKIFSPSNLRTFGYKWPSLNQVRELGKRLIIMPQNTRNEPLLFPGNWGENFKTPYVNGTIASIRPKDYEIPKIGLQLSEVGEDRTPLGSLANVPQNIPLVQNFFPKLAAGEITREDFKNLKEKGVNIISLDQITKKDSRFRDQIVVGDIPKNKYFFIPAALIAASYSSEFLGKDEILSKVQRSIIHTLINSTLPTEGKLIFSGAEQGIKAFKEHLEECEENAEKTSVNTYIDAAKKSIIPTMYGVLDSGVRIILSNITVQPTRILPIEASVKATEILASNSIAGLTNFIAGGLITKPVLNTLREVFKDTKKEENVSWMSSKFSQIMNGFIKGVEDSSFGLLNFTSENPDKMLDIIAKKFLSILSNYPELVDEQEKLYNKLVEEMNIKAIKSNIKENDIIPYPSYDKLKNYIKEKNIISFSEVSKINDGVKDLLGSEIMKEQSVQIASEAILSASSNNSSIQNSPKESKKTR